VWAHLLRLEGLVGRLNGHVLLAVDLDAVRDDSLGLALIVEGGGDGGHLSGAELGGVSIDIPSYLLWQSEPRVCGGRRRTEKSGDEAQVVVPLTSQMTALSMLPVPTRLLRGWLEDITCA
jgi:hypothetical protein